MAISRGYNNKHTRLFTIAEARSTLCEACFGSMMGEAARARFITLYARPAVDMAAKCFFMRHYRLWRALFEYYFRKHEVMLEARAEISPMMFRMAGLISGLSIRHAGFITAIIAIGGAQSSARTFARRHATPLFDNTHLKQAPPCLSPSAYRHMTTNTILGNISLAMAQHISLLA